MTINNKIDEKLTKISELQSEIRCLHKEIEQEQELLEKKYDPIKVPEKVCSMYYIDPTGKVMGHRFNPRSEESCQMYLSGALYQTRSEVELRAKEIRLEFKISEWARQHNGDWVPDWTDFVEQKFYIEVSAEQGPYVEKTRLFRSIGVRTYFPTRELASACIHHFKEEIYDVFSRNMRR